ncbi:MAG: formylglycine-generating enzyme family protein [Myxococcales bacterium]|nr:formylglycine-generating enzyme family protein [Myxococcales bacterium]MCB9553027.1 formylglycine-generating enzyme family protein [Myxococcales bacterium]
MRGFVIASLSAALAGCVSIPEWAFDDTPTPDSGRITPLPTPDEGPAEDAGPIDDMEPAPDFGCVRQDESCNGRDDDCDGQIDEGYDLERDPDNCGACDTACRPPNAEGACEARACVVAACAEGFADLDDDPISGCEYTCPSAIGPEDCNGVDDDCDGSIDEQVDGALEDQLGVCAAAVRPCNGAAGFGEPDYAALPDYQADETLCDGRDNDCDGDADEAQPELGEACAVGLGVCARAGVRVCGPDRRTAVCDAVAGAPTADADALCDGLDEDCDGRIDENAAGCIRCAGPADAAGLLPPCNACPAGTAVPSGFACVPAGEFAMGSPDDEAGRTAREGPVHPVRISRGYLIGTTEVTQRAWGRLFADDPSFFADQPRRPVERVSWYEAVAYANALSEAEGLEACYVLDGCNGAAPGAGLICAEVGFAGVECRGWRLPTEAEWERAARAGSDGRYWFGDDEGRLAMSDYFAGNSGDRTHEVGQLAPNDWGLYDVHGNVWEWVHDVYAPYEDVIERDPIGPDDGPQRVRRGGSFGALSSDARSAFRAPEDPVLRAARGGFRLVRTLP